MNTISLLQSATALRGGLRTAALPLLAALVLAGCASPPKAELDLSVPLRFHEQALAPRATTAGGIATVAAPAQADAAWWRVFGDPVLDDLIARAANRNTSIQQAAARLAEARALARSVDADRSVQVGLGASAARGAGADKAQGSRPASLFTAGLGASYELDLFGRLAGASNAAALDAASREALLRSAQLLVQSEVAQTYLALRALDVERGIMRDTVGAYRDTLSLTQRRYRAGDLAELDLVRARTELAATEAEALGVDRQRTQIEHALAVLVGDVASDFSVPAQAWTTALPSIPAGMPSTMLERRPDVIAAQQGVLAAQARVGVAQTAWFPTFSLTGAGGYASTDLGDLLQWSARSWGVGALLSLPLIDGGRREAGVQGATAQFDGAMASYREQVLTAFREVEDQLASLRLLDAQADVQAQAVASAQRATVLSESRYRNGIVSQIELLDARRSELRNRRVALGVKAAQYQATVALVRALGGGWGDEVTVSRR